MVHAQRFLAGDARIAALGDVFGEILHHGAMPLMREVHRNCPCAARAGIGLDPLFGPVVEAGKQRATPQGQRAANADHGDLFVKTENELSEAPMF